MIACASALGAEGWLDCEADRYSSTVATNLTTMSKTCNDNLQTCCQSFKLKTSWHTHVHHHITDTLEYAGVKVGEGQYLYVAVPVVSCPTHTSLYVREQNINTELCVGPSKADKHAHALIALISRFSGHDWTTPRHFRPSLDVTILLTP